MSSLPRPHCKAPPEDLPKAHLLAAVFSHSALCVVQVGEAAKGLCSCQLFYKMWCLGAQHLQKASKLEMGNFCRIVAYVATGL